MAVDYNISDLPALQRARDIMISEDIINISFIRGKRELKLKLPPYSTVRDLRNRISQEFGISIPYLYLKNGTIMFDNRPICFYGIYINCK